MLHRAGTIIAAAQTPEASLQLRSGNDVSQELGGRLLVRYMLRKQVGQFASGSSVKHFVTPTPLARTDIGSVLALPNVTVPRRWASHSSTHYTLPTSRDHDGFVAVAVLNIFCRGLSR